MVEGLQVVDPDSEEARQDNSIDISEFFDDEDGSSKDKNKDKVTVNKEEIEIVDKKTDCIKDKHSVQHVAAKGATLDKEGNIEYWYCKDCKEYYANKECTRVIKNGKKAVVIKKLSKDEDETNIKVDKEETDCISKNHHVTHVNATPATETADGNIEYWYCRDCDTYYANEKCTEIIVGGRPSTIIPAIPVVEEKTDCVSKNHDVQHVAEKKATKQEEGNIEYWYCKDCDKYYRDAACTQLIVRGKEDVVTPKLPENLEEDEPGWGRFY